MLARKLAVVNLVIATTANVFYVNKLIKSELKTLAETETVYSARQYVLVRFARGHYNNLQGIETMRYDYRFYNIIARFHDE